LGGGTAAIGAERHSVGEQNDNETENSSSEGGSILDDGGVDTDERAGRSLGIEPNKEPDDETKQEMEEEREKRLDPDNRPDGAEIDNTDRTFDVDQGMFTDNDDYEEDADGPYADPEDPNSSASAGDDDDSDSGDDDADDEPVSGDSDGSEAEAKKQDSDEKDDS
jgi:hypothetical protein